MYEYEQHLTGCFVFLPTHLCGVLPQLPEEPDPHAIGAKPDFLVAIDPMADVSNLSLLCAGSILLPLVEIVGSTKISSPNVWQSAALFKTRLPCTS